MRPRFTISLKRSTLIFSYPQAGRPITPSFGAKQTCRERRTRSDLTRMSQSGYWGTRRRTRCNQKLVVCPGTGKPSVLQAHSFLIMTHCKERTMSMAKPIWFCVLVVFGAVTAASTEGFAQQRSGVRIEGQVQTGGGPLANSTVTLWAASAGEPKQLVQTKSGSDG